MGAAGVAGLALAGAGPARADDTAAASPQKLLILGVYHFANPGRDVAKQGDDDILAPGRQRELERIAETLARFDPTVIAVEEPASRDVPLDEHYTAWIAGRSTLGRSEVEQLGFRLRRRLQLGPLRGINWNGLPPGGDFRPYDYTAWAEDQLGRGRPGARDALLEQRKSLQAWASTTDQVLQQRGLAAALRLLNSPDRLAESHRRYFDYLRFGDAEWAAGPNYVGHWMTRNLRMFENLRQIAQGHPRVLLVVGAGHAPLLSRYAADSQSFELAPTLEFLP